MKKALSIILSLFMLFGAYSAVQVSAGETEQASVIETQVFVDKLNEYLESDKTLRTYVFGNEISLGVETDFKLNADNIESKTTLFLEKDGSVVFGFVDNTCAESYELIGGYKFKNSLCFGSTGNKTGICVYKEEKVYTLREAIEKNVYTVEELAEIIPDTEKVEEPTETQPTTAASRKETTDIATVALATKPVTDVLIVSPKKANPMKVTAKTKTVKAKKLKKSKVTVTAITVKNAKGKLSYKKLSGSKKLSVTKKGKITVKKGTKKGTYKLKVKITAKGNSKYSARSVTKTVKIKVR